MKFSRGKAGEWVAVRAMKRAWIWLSILPLFVVSCGVIVVSCATRRGVVLLKRALFAIVQLDGVSQPQ